MIKIPLKNVIPLSEARSNFSKLIEEASANNAFLITKGGKPAVVIAGADMIEKLTGNKEAFSIESEEQIVGGRTSNNSGEASGGEAGEEKAESESPFVIPQSEPASTPNGGEPESQPEPQPESQTEPQPQDPQSSPAPEPDSDPPDPVDPLGVGKADPPSETNPEDKEGSLRIKKTPSDGYIEPNEMDGKPFDPEDVF